jgi:hypothetical protein
MLVALLIVTVLAAAVPLPVAAAVPRLVLDLLVLVGMVGTK